LAALKLSVACGGDETTGLSGASTTSGPGSGGSAGASTSGAAGTAGVGGATGGGGSGSSSGGAAGSGGATGGGGGSDAGTADASTDANDGAAREGAAGGSPDGASPDARSDAGSSDAGDGATSASLKIMTFNIRYGTAPDGVNAWPNRRDMVYRVIRAQNADTIGLQEALSSQLTDLATNLPEWKRVGVGRDDGVNAGEFSAILYRTARFDVESSGTFWFSDTPEVPGSRNWGNALPRICTWGHFVEKGTGRAYYQFNLHIDDQSQPSREKSVQLLMKRVTERKVPTDPVIVTGDFNSGETNVVVQYMQGKAQIGAMANPLPLVDSFRQVNPTATNVGTRHDFNGATTGDKIDYVFMGPNERATAAEIIHTMENGRYPSDHFPVTGTIDMLGWH
jgi:endonuclease/exonuclease/phosphatase family metal-dependent hydrolase